MTFNIEPLKWSCIFRYILRLSEQKLLQDMTGEVLIVYRFQKKVVGVLTTPPSLLSTFNRLVLPEKVHWA